MPPKKTVSKKPSVSPANGKNASWESQQSRMFEPVRKKVEFNLDEIVTQTLEDYEEYLSNKFGRDPNRSGIVEAVFMDAFDKHTEFQSWRNARDEEKQKIKDNTEEDTAFSNVENLGRNSAKGINPIG